MDRDSGSDMTRFKSKRIAYLSVIGIVCLLIMMWYRKPGSLQFIGLNAIQMQNDFKVNPFYLDADSLKPVEWIQTYCYHGKTPKSIESLSATVKLLKQSRNGRCRDLYISFESIYQIREKVTTIVISDTFLTKVRGWLKDNQELIEKTKHQNLIFVDNWYTTESVVFNPVRAKRPGGNGGEDKAIVDKLVAESAKSCDFCNYKKYTAADSFGRMESKYAVMISNTFKIEKYHGMVLFKHHHPSEFTLEEFLDGMDLASRWYEKTIDLAPDHVYRHMYWDVYPKASASQIHSHIHSTVANGNYYSNWDHLHRSALAYAADHDGQNYWVNLIKAISVDACKGVLAHHLLGLAVHFGKASALAYVTPRKDFGTLVISRDRNLDFFKMVYFVMRAFIDDMQLYSYSGGFVFPKLGSAPDKSGDELPAIFYVVYRGSLESSRSDFSSFDIFGTPNVNKDPYKLIEYLRASVERRKNEQYNLPDLNFS